MFLETKAKFDEIFQDKLSHDEMREYFLALYERGETASELAGAASSMRDFVIPLPISESLREKAIDIVGTGITKSLIELAAPASSLAVSPISYRAKKYSLISS
jgi:anthranilate phosphoribosyltransferase